MATPPRQMTAGATRREQIAGGRDRDCAARNEAFAHGEIFFERAPGGLTEWCQPFASTFAPDVQKTLGVLDRDQRQRDQFADAQASRIEHLDDAALPQMFGLTLAIFGPAAFSGRNQTQHFVNAQNFWQRPAQLRRLDTTARVILAHTLAVKKRIEAAQRR